MSEQAGNGPLGIVVKNLAERIEVRRTQFHGKDLVDIRVYYEDTDGEWRPTRKGISVRVEQFSELLGILIRVKQETGKSENSV